MPASFVKSAQVTELLNDLDMLQKHDRVVDAQLADAKKKQTGWGVGFVIALIAGVFSFALQVPAITVILFVVAAGCLPGLIKWSIEKSKWQKEDIENRRLELASRFLNVLGQDFPRKGKCSLKMDFQGYMKHGQQVEDQRSGFLGSMRQKKFLDTWFTAKGRLLDDSIFRVSIEQVIRRKEKAKRKYTKITERITEKVTLSLRVSPESYPQWAQLSSLLQPAEIPSMRITRVSVQNGAVRVTGETPPVVKLTGRSGTHVIESNHGAAQLASGDALLQLFIYVYSQLQNCRPQPASAGNASPTV